MSDTRAELTRLVHASARHLDDRDFAAYLSLFTEAGEYRIEVRAPELPDPMTWMHMNREELGKRLDSVPRHEWQILQPVQTRIVSVDQVDVGKVAAATSSSFAIFNTEADGHSRCYAVGRYDDHWVLSEGAWKIASRTVRLRTRMLMPPTPVPL
jgi:3-phenylpropionate/cinnamic acid dioxygenase small subunit